MTSHSVAFPSFWTTVRLLLVVSRKRAFGRLAHQRKVLQMRGVKGSATWSLAGFAFVFLVGIALNFGAAFDLLTAFSAGQRVQAAAEGNYVVADWFIPAASDLLNQLEQNPKRRAEINQTLTYAAVYSF